MKTKKFSTAALLLDAKSPSGSLAIWTRPAFLPRAGLATPQVCSTPGPSLQNARRLPRCCDSQHASPYMCVCVHGGGRHWAQPRADPLAITRSHRCCLWPWPWSLSQSQRESSSSSCPHPPSSLYPRTTSQLRAGGKNPKNILRISLLGTYHKDRVHRKKNAKSIKMFSAALLLLLRLVVARGDTHRHAETETPSPAVPPPARTFDRRTV